MTETQVMLEDVDPQERERHQLVREGIMLLALLLISIIGMKVAFYEENMLRTIRFTLSLFWLFALPGYMLMLFWRNSLSFLERLVAGIALAVAVTGIASYYLGLAGIHNRYHAMILPILLMTSGVAASWLRARGKKHKKGNNPSPTQEYEEEDEEESS